MLTPGGDHTFVDSGAFIASIVLEPRGVIDLWTHFVGLVTLLRAWGSLFCRHHILKNLQLPRGVINEHSLKVGLTFHQICQLTILKYFLPLFSLIFDQVDPHFIVLRSF